MHKAEKFFRFMQGLYDQSLAMNTSDIVRFETIVGTWKESLGIDASKPMKEPLLDCHRDPWIELLEKGGGAETRLWVCMDKKINSQDRRCWTSKEFKRRLHSIVHSNVRPFSFSLSFRQYKKKNRNLLTSTITTILEIGKH